MSKDIGLLYRNYYTALPSTVRYNDELCAGAKLLYAELKALSNDCGYSYAYNSYFATVFGVCKSTVRRWIAELEKQGLVSSTYRVGGDRMVTVCDGTAEAVQKIKDKIASSNANTSASEFIAIIPKAVRRDKRLPMHAKALYGELYSRSNTTNYCSTSTKEFAQLYSVAESTVRAWLHMLTKLNYIYIELCYSQDGCEVKSRRIYLVDRNKFLDRDKDVAQSTAMHNRSAKRSSRLSKRAERAKAKAVRLQYLAAKQLNTNIERVNRRREPKPPTLVARLKALFKPIKPERA